MIIFISCGILIQKTKSIQEIHELCPRFCLFFLSKEWLSFPINYIKNLVIKMMISRNNWTINQTYRVKKKQLKNDNYSFSSKLNNSNILCKFYSRKAVYIV